MNIVFATNNQHKLEEIQKLVSTDFIILKLNDIGCFEELQENQNTLEGNASEKSWYIYNKYQMNCFADDTGLEIEVLNGRPGVFSARYAGLQKSFADNMKKVLKEMQEKSNRKARFRTVISLIINGKEKIFEGIVNGIILQKPRGDKGFGYDPIFQPDGYDLSFAEMSLEEKNKISHRGKAVELLVEYLKQVH